MRIYRRILIVLAASLVSSHCRAQIAGNSLPVQHQVLPWGNADLIKTAGGIDLRFTLHQQPVNQVADSSSSSLIIPSYSCFVQIPSGKKITLQIQRHSSHRIAVNKLNNRMQSALAKVATNASVSLVQLKGYRWFRGKRLAQLNISAYTNNGPNVQAVDTIEIALNYATSFVSDKGTVTTAEDKQFKSILHTVVLNTEDASTTLTEPLRWADSTKLWLPQNGKAIKLTIPNDGVYRLTYSDLLSAAPELSQVDPQTFRLFNKGKELPLYIKTGTKGLFDYIEFLGLRNYNEASYRHVPVGEEEYSEYLNRYTDTSYYWLTWGGAQGKRYVSNDTTALPIETIQWYTEKLHMEQNTNYAYIGDDQIEQQNPFWTSGDIWYWSMLFANGEFDVPFNISQLNTSTTTFRIYAKVANSAANLGITPVSVLKMGINTYLPSDTTSLNQFEQKIIQKDIPLSKLSEGSNTFHLFSSPTLSSTNSVVVDWVDIEYPRILKTAIDSLWFGFSDLSGTSVRKVVIQGLTTTDYILYKVQVTPKKIAGYTISGSNPYSISFIDTVGNGDRYVLLLSSKVQKPVLRVRNSFANLRDSTRHADYLLITNSDYSGFSSIANSYSALIHQTYGLNSAVIDVNDMYDEFGYGYPVPESIREFLKATTKWSAPMPSYVFMVGRANYDFKNYIKTPGGSTMPNIVPVYGMPVSDTWVATLDDSLVVPQMYVGRLPALTQDEFQKYYQHVQTYTSTSFDDWNKRYMFFAGGSDSNETNSFHSENRQVIQSIVNPAPVGGIATDFYKTSSPQSDYGPYTQEQFNNAIDSGAVLIAYIGHSGTQTWDNNIADITKLQNTRGRFALISDFGCSTAKCAEPNIRAFGELFTVDPNGSAIGYIGNSSLGFTSIATTFPLFFYRTILLDSIHTIGEAHLQAKIKDMESNGWQQSAMGRQLMLTNVLIGDPAIELAIPTKPNLSVSSNEISSIPAFPSDDNDSLQLKIPYHNFGIVLQDSFQVRISQTYLTAKSDTTLVRKLPLYADTLTLSYPIYNLPGIHDFAVQFNPYHIINEINYADNSAVYSNVVQSIALRVIYPIPGYRSPATKFVLMNPIKQSVNAGKLVILEIDTTSSFKTPSTFQIPLGQVVTECKLPQLLFRRYYWRAQTGSLPIVSGSFIPSTDSMTHWTQSLPEEWQKDTYTNTGFDSSGAHIYSTKNYSFHIVSAGDDIGRQGVVEINGANVLPSSILRGINVVQLDTMDFHVVQFVRFDTYGGSSGKDPSYADSLAMFLNTMPYRSLVAMMVIGEGSNSLTQNARNAIKQFGSQYIDNLGWRQPWALFGQKGSEVGTVLEQLLSSNQLVTLDTNISRPSFYGDVLSEPFGPVSQWNKAFITSTVPQGGQLKLYVLGGNTAGAYDTLLVNDTSAITLLTSIDAQKYLSLRLMEKYWANAQGISPILKNWDVTLIPPPELAINYQCVALSYDSVLEGNTITMKTDIHNIGEAQARNVHVLFSILNNGIRQQDTILIPSIPSDSFKTIQYSINTTGKLGMNTAIINIDPTGAIPEIYKVNNYYSVPFFVKKDTIRPTYDITFDGIRIYDGDYTLPRPTIQVKIFDNSPLPISSASNVIMKLDSRPITLGLSSDSLFETRPGPEKAMVVFKPVLETGTHSLSFQVKDATGNYADTSAREINFKVETEMKLLNVFNYPNPFASETYFTFILTDYVDEVEIKIYTINGRLIQDILVSPQSEKAYYQVYWNGRDRDGDEVANGVYFYKVIAKSNGLTKEVIQKLAKVR